MRARSLPVVLLILDDSKPVPRPVPGFLAGHALGPWAMATSGDVPVIRESRPTKLAYRSWPTSLLSRSTTS
jgi:hypothetical protein